MRKTLHIGLIILLLMGCEKIFHQEDASLAHIKSFEELSEAAGGVYGRLLSSIYPEYGLGNIYLPNIKGDDITRKGTSYYNYYFDTDCSLEEEFKFDNAFQQEYIAESQSLWENFYRVIISANNILNQFPDPSIERKDYQTVLGEMYLIRAYCHFRLIRCFDRIPVVTENTVDYSSSLPTYDQIYGQIVKDLQMAVQLLPLKAAETRIPYISPRQGSAKVLLAEVYLNWAGYPALNTGMYDEAARIAGNLIDSADYYDLELVPDFKDIWNWDPNQNKEVVFSVSFADPGHVFPVDFNEFYTYISRPQIGHSDTSTFGFYITPDSVITSAGFYGCEMNFYNRFPKSYRKDNTFFSRIYVPGSWGITGVDTGYVEVENWDFCGRPAYNKFLHDARSYPTWYFDRWWLDGNFLFGTPRVYFFRFAHTLLTYAEAKARSGEPDESAYEALNRVRRRAHHVDLYSPSVYDLQQGLSAEAFADSVVNERAWELAGEPEGRWFDLVRLEKVELLQRIRHKYEGDVPLYPITKNDYFFPIPEGDLRLNPNLVP